MPKDLQDLIDEPVSGFGEAETLLSRTDDRGVITFANAAFVRLSGYDRDDLIGAPHRVIRHPDMPKAVFQLFWDTLKNGAPFCAYVKNKALDGRYYWVFAIAVPIEGGYLSVRLKPSSPWLEKAKTFYTDILASERADGEAPEQGVLALEEAVQHLGFQDYAGFIGTALIAELTGRGQILERALDRGVIQFKASEGLLGTLIDEVKLVQDLLDEVKGSPANLNILGTKMTKGREAMRVVASNYGELMADFVQIIQQLDGRLATLVDLASAGQVSHCARVLYTEVIADFALNEPEVGSSTHQEELVILQSALAGFAQSAEKACRRIKDGVLEFVATVQKLRRLLLALSVTRVMCSIEAASALEYVENITDIVERLEHFQEKLGKALDRVVTVSDNLTDNLPGT